jgi:hypothetical protein
MSRVGGAVAITLALSMSAQAQSGHESAQEMLSHCRTIISADMQSDGRIYPALNFDSGMCWGGFSALQTATKYTDGDGPLFDTCIPAESNRTQLVAVFANFANRHPEKLHERWLTVALEALIEAFPCK